MVGDWMKIELALPDKPEVVEMATRLRTTRDAVVGKLVRVWAWAHINSVDGAAMRITGRFLDELTACRGFADALRAVGWLAGDDLALTFPHFDRHNGQTAKARAEGNRRVAEHRRRNGATVTDHPPEPPPELPTCNGRTVTDVTPAPLPKPLPERERETTTTTTHTAEAVSLQTLRACHPHLDVDAEFAAAARHCRAKYGRTEVDLVWFARDWLPKAGPKVAAGAPARRAAAAADEPDGWREWLRVECPGNAYAEGGAQAGTPWAEMDPAVQRFIADGMAKTRRAGA